MIYKLIKAGYGTYNDILNLDFDVFIDICNYEQFINHYEDVYLSYSNKK